MAESIYEFSPKAIDGSERSLAEFEGKVLLVVNVASRCGFTPQYKGLQKLYEKYEGQGLVVLGFPCNQFLSQEPDTEAEIQNFCEANYGVTFPLFSKIEVNGENAHPLYSFLKEAAPGALGSKSIKWNFTKFLVGRDGKAISRFSPKTPPDQIAADIEAALT